MPIERHFKRGCANTLLVCLCAFFLVTEGVAQDENWQEYATGGDGTKFLFHRGRLNGYKAKVFLVWTKAIYLEPRTVKGEFIVSSMSKIRLDCEKKMIQILSFSEYAKNGTVITATTKLGPAQEIGPDTTAEGLIEMLCF